MKILLTGAQGQLGQEIMELAKKGACELLAFSKADFDILNAAQSEDLIKTHQPQLLINAAAYTAVDKAEQELEKAYAINRDAVHQLAKLCKRNNLPLIHLSTDYVFDGTKDGAYCEDDPYSPLNVYGASKAQGEVLLRQEWEKHVIVRTSWVFGQYGGNFVKTILRLALKQRELRIVSDQRGCPTAAADLAAALLSIAARIHQGHSQWGVFHYRGDQETDWQAFAGKIIQYGRSYFPFKLEKLLAITSAEYPTAAKRPKNSVLNMNKIEQAYGLRPGSWEKSLQSVIQAIQQTGEMHEHFPT